MDRRRRGRARGFALAVLRLLLPRTLGRRHGDDLVRFLELQRHEPRYAGILGGLRYWAHVTIDVVRTAVRVKTSTVSTVRLRPRRRGKGGEGMMHSAVHELRGAFKSLRSARLHSVMTILTLAMGIGATTSIFTIVDGVLLKPLPYEDSEDLVLVNRTRDGQPPSGVSWPDFDDWRTELPGLTALAAHMESSGTFQWSNGAEEVTGSRITHDLFPLLGVEPVLGRNFSAAEASFDGPDAVILSHGFWRSAYGGAKDLLGKTVEVDGEAVPVVGIMPPGFAFPGPENRFWRPMHADRVLEEVGLPTGIRTLTFMEVLGRLMPGLGTDEAEARLSTVAGRIDQAEATNTDRGVLLTPLIEAWAGDLRPTLVLLMGSVGMVLLIACANVAGLAIGRASAREREVAVRTALGAGRSRLVLHLLAESLLLAGFAGLLGLAISAMTIDALLALAPSDLPRQAEVGPSLSSVRFAIVASFASAILYGLIPAIRASRSGSGSILGHASRGSSAGRSVLRPQRILVVGQVTIAVALLSAAGLFIGTITRLNSVNPGFEADGVLLAALSLPSDDATSPETVTQFFEEALGTVRALPGVHRATTTNAPPTLGNTLRQTIVAEGEEVDPESLRWVGVVIVGGDYFATMGVPLIAGREFDGGDRLGEPLVAIVNVAMAEQLWPGEDPLGRRFKTTGGMRGSAEDFDPAFFPRDWYTVVGVAGDVRREGMAVAPEPEFFRPHAQVPWAFRYLAVRTSSDPDALAGPVREAVWSVNGGVPVYELQTLRSGVRRSLAPYRFRTTLIGAFAIMAASLAMVGVYGVTALAVGRRVREIGIRLALGAESGQVLRAVVKGALRLVGIGVGLGLAVSLAAGRLIESMLFDVRPEDPLTFVIVAAITAAVAVVASYAPAKRASRIDPVSSLQAE